MHGSVRYPPWLRENAPEAVTVVGSCIDPEGADTDVFVLRYTPRTISPGLCVQFCLTQSRANSLWAPQVPVALHFGKH